LRPTARVVVPSPSYTTHSSAEAAHAGDRPVTYWLNPNNYWYPDLDDLEKRIKYNPAVAGILIINPDNPTGFVYPEETLRQIVRIAREYELFLILDETYINIIYNDKQTVPVSDVIEDVPGFSMKGVSKEFPWPGARCGWIEVYNAGKDPIFDRYIDTILHQKMSEVCSTTLPQIAIPRIMTHPEYKNYLSERIGHYEKLSNIAYNILKDVPYLTVNRTNGAFYMTAVFNESVMNNRQTLPIKQPEIRDYIEKLVDDKIQFDKRFVYYLLGSTGICVVPLTSFFTSLQGFRMTLLDKDPERFEATVRTIADKIVQYIDSSNMNGSLTLL